MAQSTTPPRLLGAIPGPLCLSGKCPSLERSQHRVVAQFDMSRSPQEVTTLANPAIFGHAYAFKQDVKRSKIYGEMPENNKRARTGFDWRQFQIQSLRVMSPGSPTLRGVPGGIRGASVSIKRACVFRPRPTNSDKAWAGVRQP